MSTTAAVISTIGVACVVLLLLGILVMLIPFRLRDDLLDPYPEDSDGEC